MDIDSLDRLILDGLRVDGRASFADIGKRVGLSPSAVKRRIDRMTAEGVIRGFGVRLDPTVDGQAVEAIVELFCTGTVAPEELRRILGGNSHVVEAWTVTGSADALVRMRAATMIDLEEALETIRLARQVDNTRSALVLSRLVENNSA